MAGAIVEPIFSERTNSGSERDLSGKICVNECLLKTTYRFFPGNVVLITQTHTCVQPGLTAGCPRHMATFELCSLGAEMSSFIKCVQNKMQTAKSDSFSSN